MTFCSILLINRFCLTIFNAIYILFNNSCRSSFLKKSSIFLNFENCNFKLNTLLDLIDTI